MEIEKRQNIERRLLGSGGSLRYAGLRNEQGPLNSGRLKKPFLVVLGGTYSGERPAARSLASLVGCQFGQSSRITYTLKQNNRKERSQEKDLGRSVGRSVDRALPSVAPT